MAIPVTQTKIVLPRRRNDLLTRPRLLDLVYELLDYKLIIVAAPAGYGKTSLLVDFSHQAEIPVCWLALDIYDRDPQRFLAHLIASLSNRFPTFGYYSKTFLDSSTQVDLNIDRIIPTIINEAYENIKEHFILVIDDYHLVDEVKDIVLFINRFVQEVDENCHLVLSTRALPVLPDMPLMVGRSLVGGLSFEELAFRPEEIQSLARQNYKLNMPIQAAEELARETEGWIIGLLLSTHPSWQGKTQRLRIARVSGVGLNDYMAQQVLDRQPTRVKEFLLKTAFLEEFDAELCQAVLGPGEDCASLIQTLIQNNLFVLPVGEDSRWIRYHHLFRDFLQSYFSTKYPEEKDRILRKLVNIYTVQGEWEKAYAACQRLGDLQAEVELINRAGSELVKNGQILTLSSWIEAVPREVLENHPGLQSLQGAVALMMGQVEEGRKWLEKADKALGTSGDHAAIVLNLTRLATAYRFLGDFKASLNVSKQVLATAGEREPMLPFKAEALRTMGNCLYQLGRLNEAVENLELSLNTYVLLKYKQNIATVLMELALAFTGRGNYNQAMKFYNQSLSYYKELNNPFGQATLLNNLGVLQFLIGDYEQAFLSFQEAISLSEKHNFIRMVAYSYCSTGELYTDLVADQSAREAYQLARLKAREINDLFLIFYLDLSEADLSRSEGNLDLAREFIASAKKRVMEAQSDYEIGLWKLESGKLKDAEGNFTASIQFYREAAEHFESGGQALENVKAHFYLANAYFLSKQDRFAYEELLRAFIIASGFESSHFLVTVGRQAKEFLDTALKQGDLRDFSSDLLARIQEFEIKIPSLRRKLRSSTTSVPFAPPKMTIQALGKSQVAIDGQVVTAAEWQAQRRVRDFFFCLLAHPDGISRDELVTLFWPDTSPHQVKLQLKNTIYRLRHSLIPDVIGVEEDRYWFNRHIDYEYDVEIFIRKVTQAIKEKNRYEKVARYREAVEIYQGEFLPGYDLPWALPLREQYWQMYASALIDLSRLYLESGDYSAAIDYARFVLAGDSCYEEAHRLIMQAFDAIGDKAAVARQFEICRQALLEEINSPPSKQTEMLYEALR